MSNQAYRELLDLLMVSDPEPCQMNVLKAWANEEAKRRGFDGWVVAYHHPRSDAVRFLEGG